MKKLNSLKLNHLSKVEMEKRELNTLKGGVCGCVSYCGCIYAGEQCPSGDSYYGGSTTGANGSANGDQAWQTQQQ